MKKMTSNLAKSKTVRVNLGLCTAIKLVPSKMTMIRLQKSFDALFSARVTLKMQTFDARTYFADIYTFLHSKIAFLLYFATLSYWQSDL